jgi:hypothetical protein
MMAALILLTVMTLVGTIGWVVWSFQRERHLLHALPRTPIRDLVVGSKVRIIGTARSLGHEVGGHISGTPCLACHSWILTMAGSDATTMPPYEDRVVAFKVEDDTGTIDIGVEKVSLLLNGGIVDVKDSHAFGASVVRREGGLAVTYYEDRLPVDSRVAVIGYVVTSSDGTKRLTGQRKDPLVIANVADAFG